MYRGIQERPGAEQFHCPSCRMNISGRECVRQHIKGRRHTRNYAMQDHSARLPDPDPPQTWSAPASTTLSTPASTPTVSFDIMLHGQSVGKLSCEPNTLSTLTHRLSVCTFKEEKRPEVSPTPTTPKDEEGETETEGETRTSTTPSLPTSKQELPVGCAALGGHAGYVCNLCGTYCSTRADAVVHGSTVQHRYRLDHLARGSRKAVRGDTAPPLFETNDPTETSDSTETM